jgi:hypothetical protein
MCSLQPSIGARHRTLFEKYLKEQVKSRKIRGRLFSLETPDASYIIAVGENARQQVAALARADEH